MFYCRTPEKIKKNTRKLPMHRKAIYLHARRVYQIQFQRICMYILGCDKLCLHNSYVLAINNPMQTDAIIVNVQ